MLLQDPEKLEEEEAFLHVLYMSHHLSTLCQILDQESAQPIVQQQISLVASLISKTCKDEDRREKLRYCNPGGGVLTCLATRLASFIVTPGYIPDTGVLVNSNARIQQAGPKAHLAPLLQAACTIIQESKIRVSRFCCSDAFNTVFPSDKDPYSWRVPARSNGRREPSNTSFDSILPPLTSQNAGRSSNYPPFNSLATWGKQQSSHRAFSSAMDITPTERFTDRDSDETGLVPWLLEVVKAKSGMTRLMAIWLLALLYRSNAVSLRREKSLSMQLVPILVGMLDKDYRLTAEEELPHELSRSEPAARTILQKAPRILALLVAENEDYQKAAADADVVKKLSQLLKQSFDPIPLASLTPMWNPTPVGTFSDAPDASSPSKLGPHGLQPIEIHTLRIRESALIALNAMATSKDEYRKAIIDNNVVPFIIESLKPHHKSLVNNEKVQNGIAEKDKRLGNTKCILIAACNAARALSRSVSSLRTILVDAGLSDPIYKLLKHPDIDVQTAATSAVINIILEFSPMREVYSSSTLA